MLGTVSGAISLALRRIDALLASRLAAADRIVDGRAGTAGTSGLAAVAHTEPSRLQITDGTEGTAAGTTGIGIIRLAGAAGRTLGGAGSGRGVALRRGVSGELGEAEVVVGALLGSAFQWLEAVFLRNIC